MIGYTKFCIDSIRHRLCALSLDRLNKFMHIFTYCIGLPMHVEQLCTVCALAWHSKNPCGHSNFWECGSEGEKTAGDFDTDGSFSQRHRAEAFWSQHNTPEVEA